MKKSIEDLAKAAPGATSGIPGMPGGGFLNQLVDGVRQFKEALQLIKEIKGVPGQMNQARENATGMENEPGKQPVNPKLLQPPLDPIMPIIALLEILNRAGHGEKTIGQLIKDISPFTIEQVKGILANARSRK
ncbi:hypothetical protein ES703_31833 [subsurface metagenome]